MVSDWKDCWKWYSVHAAVILVVLNAVQQLLPQFVWVLDPQTYAWVNATLGVAVILGRVTSQGDINADNS